MIKGKRFWLVAAAICATLAAASFPAERQKGKAGVGLENLELSGGMGPIEPYVIKLDPAFSRSFHGYSVTVDSTNNKSIGIIPTPASSEDKVTINGAWIDSGKPYRADLKLGDNQFAISVGSADRADVHYNLTVVQKDLSGKHKSELVQKEVWRITDYGGFPPCEDMYLIEGAQKALLIDAGMRQGDLAQLVKKLTPLPIEVALTHGHGDHIGQVNQFPDSTVYMSEKDKGMLPTTLPTGNFKWVRDGDRIDLGGGKTLEVVEVPGHTAGSIMFLDAADRTLTVGDAIGSGSYVWMFIPGTPSLTEYRDTLKRLEKRLAAYNSLTFLTGHHWQERTPLTGKTGKQMVTDMRILCEKVISGEVVGTSGSTNLGQRKINYRTAQYGLAGMWYDPEKIEAAN